MDGLFTNTLIIKNTLLRVKGFTKKYMPATVKDNTYLFSFKTEFNNLMELDAKKINKNDKYHQCMAAYVNHDKKSPNKSIIVSHILYQHDMFLEFTKDIEKNNEIYWNYGSEYWNENKDKIIINDINNNKRKSNSNSNDNNKKQKL